MPGESSNEIERLLACDPRPNGWLVRATTWESKILWKLSTPSIVVSIFNFMLSVATQMFVGHLGALELAGASIASVGIQGLAYGIMLGLATAVQTLCGQAYGAKTYNSMGVVCQKAIIVHMGAAFILTFLYWFSGPVLRAIGQSEDIAAQAQIFSRGLLLQLYALALYDPMQRFLQAQNIVNPLAYIAVGVFLFHVLITWVAVMVLKYGLLGAALTLSFSWWILVLLTFLYIVFSPSCKETWSGFSRKAFIGIWAYLKIAIASAFMLVLEIWYSQGLVLISGLLPNPEVALDSISICMNYLNWDMMFMLGFSAAAGIRVGNEVGAAHPRVARFSVIIVVVTCVTISIILSVAVRVFQAPLSKLFTTNSEVIKAVEQLTPLLAISVFLNGIQPILSGVAIGSGWQALVAYVNLTTYYLIGLPIGCVLAFKTGLGVRGIWWGMICGVALQTITLIVFTARVDWNSEVNKAQDRLKRSADEQDHPPPVVDE